MSHVFDLISLLAIGQNLNQHSVFVSLAGIGQNQMSHVFDPVSWAVIGPSLSRVSLIVSWLVIGQILTSHVFFYFSLELIGHYQNHASSSFQLWPVCVHRIDLEREMRLNLNLNYRVSASSCKHIRHKQPDYCATKQ